MSLKKIIQMRKGTISMSVFQGEDDGKVLLSIDKDFVSRRVKGPLFTETELGEVAWLIQDYQEWEHKAVPNANREDSETVSYDRGIAKAEVEAAVNAMRAAAQQRPPAQKAATITVLPTMPDYKYVHTCPKCGCHVPSYLRLPGSTVLKICMNCATTYGQSRS